MKNCPDYQETLWLDVHGELDAKDRPAWEEHLKTCAACREERERMRHLMTQIKDEMPLPVLSNEKARTLSRSIKRRLGAETSETSWWRRFVNTPNRFVPALAAAMLVVLAVTWFSRDLFRSPTVLINREQENKMAVNDGEVIRNLELLEEMDTLQKLVQALDQKETM